MQIGMVLLHQQDKIPISHHTPSVTSFIFIIFCAKTAQKNLKIKKGCFAPFFYRVFSKI